MSGKSAPLCCTARGPAPGNHGISAGAARKVVQICSGHRPGDRAAASEHLTRHFPHPPEAVWKALTTPELLARWWAPGDIAPTQTANFRKDRHHGCGQSVASDQ